MDPMIKKQTFNGGVVTSGSSLASDFALGRYETAVLKDQGLLAQVLYANFIRKIDRCCRKPVQLELDALWHAVATAEAIVARRRRMGVSD
jgi:hypothetical protein